MTHKTSFQCLQLVAPAGAAAAAPNSNGSNNHYKRMIRFSGMQGGEKSMNEKKKGSVRSCGGAIYISLEFNLSTKW